MIIPNIWENKSHVQNHQPDLKHTVSTNPHSSLHPLRAAHVSLPVPSEIVSWPWPQHGHNSLRRHSDVKGFPRTPQTPQVPGLPAMWRVWWSLLGPNPKSREHKNNTFAQCLQYLGSWMKIAMAFTMPFTIIYLLLVQSATPLHNQPMGRKEDIYRPCHKGWKIAVHTKLPDVKGLC